MVHLVRHAGTADDNVLLDNLVRPRALFTMILDERGEGWPGSLGRTSKQTVYVSPTASEPRASGNADDRHADLPALRGCFAGVRSAGPPSIPVDTMG